MGSCVHSLESPGVYIHPSGSYTSPRTNFFNIGGCGGRAPTIVADRLLAVRVAGVGVAEKALSFFRFFDLAFFLPGAMLAGALAWKLGLLSRFRGSPPGGALGSLVAVLAGLMSIYFLGLVIHAVQRLLNEGPGLSRLKCRDLPTAGTSPWFTHLDDGRSQDLVLYFWYLRATCWNTAVAVVIASVVCAVVPGPQPRGWFWAVPPIVAPLLIYLGWDFERAWQSYLAYVIRTAEDGKTSGPTLATTEETE